MLRLSEIFRYVIPPRDQQIEITPSFGLVLIAPAISIIYMAYLARLPDTRLQRSLLFPIPFLLWIRVAFAYRSTDPFMLAASVLKSLLFPSYVNTVLVLMRSYLDSFRRYYCGS